MNKSAQFYMHVVMHTVQLDLNFKKLACALHAALHEPKNIRCMSGSAREGDEDSTTRGE